MTKILAGQPEESLPMAKAYRQRLVVYVVWHPEFQLGADLARRIYDHLMRDSQQPIARGLGIPVFYRSVAGAEGSDAPIEIPLDAAQHTATVVLVDDHMVLARGAGWADYLEKLAARVALDPEAHRLLPVLFSPHGLKLSPKLSASNFIQRRNFPPERWALKLLESQSSTYPLLNAITHELCRILLHQPRLEHDSHDYGGRLGEPVTIFISHAKKDGAKMAEGVRNYIAQNLQLKTFFDVNDIPFGSGFAQILEDSVDREHTAVLVIQTDEYSTREWCQREVLWAKKYERPVLIAHAVQYGEKCSFPYLGNAPTIRFDPEKGPDFDALLGQMLVEVLRNNHFRQHFEDLRSLFGLGSGVRALPQTPELLTLLEIRSDPKSQDIKTIVYPEPPLGEHLLDILRRFTPALTVTTPVLLLTSGLLRAGGERLLTGKTIGLSIGKSPDLDRLGLDPIHVEDALVELARYLLECGATLAFGGDLRPGGFTEILRDLVWIYDASDSTSTRLRGYLAWPIHQDRAKKDPAYLDWMDPKNRTEFRFIPRPPDQAQSRAEPPRDRSPENLLVWSRCLTSMRETMNAETDARILLGGRVTGYMGRYPGVAEEALLAKRSGKPLYLCGGFGGYTRAVVDAILGRPTAPMTETYQYADSGYHQMVDRLNASQVGDPVNYAELMSEFATWKVFGLAAMNGLTVEENLTLFETPHTIEIIYLVLRGLLRLYGPTP
jgi:hypothetical protein